MKTQQIELDLLAEFKRELEKTNDIQSKNIIFSKNLNKNHSEFWNKFLTEKFPEGSINKTLEKNFALWIINNKLDFSQIKKMYAANNWKVGGLLGWIKKVNAGEILEYSSGELMNWAKTNKPEFMEFLKDKNLTETKLENSKGEKLLFISDEQLSNYEDKNSNEFIIDNFCKPKQIGIFGGKRSTLKSWLGINLIYSVCESKNFLGKFKTNKGISSNITKGINPMIFQLIFFSFLIIYPLFR